eukprot:7949058-Pyramimonas_sp.AAC.1
MSASSAAERPARSVESRMSRAVPCSLASEQEKGEMRLGELGRTGGTWRRGRQWGMARRREMTKDERTFRVYGKMLMSWF